MILTAATPVIFLSGVGRVLRGVVFGSLLTVMFGLEMMAMSQMSVMPGHFMFAGFVVLGGSQMMFSRLLVMVRGLAMVFGAWM